MAITKEVFYTESLSCNCPQCYAQTGLELRFHQDWKENAFSKRATETVREELYCKQCENTIYPVDWTDDIERLYEYHFKRAEPSTYSKIKPLFWGVIGLLVVAIALGLFLLVKP